MFRWFVGMNLDEPVWDVTVFTKNRNRLLEGDVAREFLCEVIAQARNKGRDAVGSVGESEELSTQGSDERPAG